MDIVERLRKAQQTFYGDTSINELHMYAADEIERLREALRHYACNCQNTFDCLEEQCGGIALSALQQKDSE